MKTRVALMASGSGSTAEAFIRATHDGKVDADIVLVTTNNPQAGVLERISNLNQELNLSIETCVISSKTHPASASESVEPGCQTISEQHAILDIFEKYRIELVLLLGYMKKVGPHIVEQYGWQPSYTSPYQARMLNTHPGLLPDTKGFIGIHVQEHVLANKLEAGQTLHVVSENYDDGPTIAENKVAILPNDTPETLFSRVQITEKAKLPGDVSMFITTQRTYMKEQS